MELEILAISDTHSGEGTSLLSFTKGRQKLWKSLRDAFGEGPEKKSFKVEDLILIGDIPDRCISSTNQIIEHTSALIKTLGSAASVKKGIYIPGNHDHTLWTSYIDKKYGLKSAITKPEGELLVQKGRINNLNSAEELVEIFFDYPESSLWREISNQKKLNFAIANPIYAKVINGRTYVFTHGTHFRPDVTQPEWVKRVIDWLQLDRFAGIEVDSDRYVGEAQSLEELEEIASRLVDTLWISSFDNPNPTSDRLWYFFNLISGKFSQKRPTPYTDQLFTQAELQNNLPKRIMKLVSKNNRLLDDSLQRWREFMVDYMLDYLDQNGLLNPDLTFVYGDTHRGGYGKYDYKYKGKTRKFRIYNTGGWGTTHKENHPACHIFAVDKNGNEYLLDLSYKDVNVHKKSLIELASMDAEDRNSFIGGIIRWFTER